MEAAALCVRLLMLEFILLGTRVQKSYTVYGDAVFVRINPNSQQHFEYEPVSFQCEGSDGSTQLRGVGSSGEINPACKNKRTSTGSVCTFSNIYEADSGKYWCETKGGQKSNSINITVTAGSVILDSSALPLLEGDTLTLRCKSKTRTSNLPPVFYKDDVPQKTGPTGEMTINNFNKSDEGLYRCSIRGVGESPGSWLAVRDLKDALPSDSGTPQTHNPAGIAVTIIVMVLVLLAGGFLYIRNHRALPSYQSVMLYFSSKMPTRTSQSGQDNQMVSGDESADDSVTYAVVITKQRKNKDSAGAADTDHHVETSQSRKPRTEREKEDTIYATVKTSQRHMNTNRLNPLT